MAGVDFQYRFGLLLYKSSDIGLKVILKRVRPLDHAVDKDLFDDKFEMDQDFVWGHTTCNEAHDLLRYYYTFQINGNSGVIGSTCFYG